MPYAAPSKHPALRLAQHFASLKDPRVAGRTEHPLLSSIAAKRAKAARNTDYREHVLTLGIPLRLVRSP